MIHCSLRWKRRWLPLPHFLYRSHTQKNTKKTPPSILYQHWWWWPRCTYCRFSVSTHLGATSCHPLLNTAWISHVTLPNRRASLPECGPSSSHNADTNLLWAWVSHILPYFINQFQFFKNINWNPLRFMNVEYCVPVATIQNARKWPNIGAQYCAHVAMRKKDPKFI